MLFNNNLYIIGDATKPIIEIPEKNLDNQDLIQQICANKLGNIFQQGSGVMETKNKIMEKISETLENNATALGPAVLAAYYLLENAELGSQLVLCTDGLANIGLGSLDGTEAALKEAAEFYRELGVKAQ